MSTLSSSPALSVTAVLFGLSAKCAVLLPRHNKSTVKLKQIQDASHMYSVRDLESRGDGDITRSALLSTPRSREVEWTGSFVVASAVYNRGDVWKAWAYHTCITILVGLVRQTIASISLLGKPELVQQVLVPTADPQKREQPTRPRAAYRSFLDECSQLPTILNLPIWLTPPSFARCSALRLSNSVLDPSKAIA